MNQKISNSAVISEKKSNKEIFFLYSIFLLIVLSAFIFIKQINSNTDENVISYGSNTKEVASSYLGTNSSYSNVNYKDPILCGLPASKGILAIIKPVKSGLWTDNATWSNGIKPTANDVVDVPSGVVLTMVGTCRAKSISVNGTLNAVISQETGAWINLETEGIMVNSGGKLEVGTENQPYYAKEKCIITLKGNKIANSPDSFKSIMVMGGGTLELHGKKRTSWTNIAATANVGATQITLKQAVEWEIGDKIALTSTAFVTETAKGWENVDESEITGISNDGKTLTLKTPLKFKHIGGSKSYTRAKDGKKWNVDIFGEVGLLSHYITIQGEMGTANETSGFGGHIMMMKGSTAHVEYVELYKMGQKSVLGRYPFHWHMCEDKAKGNYLKNSSVHKSFNRAVTIHGTDYVTVDGVFAYDHIGHGIFLEEGGERFNTIKNNVVFITRRPKKGEELTPSDNQFNVPQNRTPASYWITNPNNIFENNVAAGTEGTGFWIALPNDGGNADPRLRKGKPMGISGQTPYFNGVDPLTEKFGKFSGFVAHSCMNGWDMFDQLSPLHSIESNSGWWVTTKQYIDNGMLYGNETAVYCGLDNYGDPNNVVFRNCVFSDNNLVSMLAADLNFENCLFNVDSELGISNETRYFFRFYDGPGKHINCHFQGWNKSNANMVYKDGGGGATTNMNPSYIGSTSGTTEPHRFRFDQMDESKGVRARSAGLFFKDYDGGLTGKAHTTIIRDIPFLRDGHEYRHPSWAYAARSDYYFGQLWLHDMNGASPGVSVLRTKSGTANACFFDIGEIDENGKINNGTYKFPLIVDQNFLYTFSFSKVPSTANKITLFWNRADINALTLTCFKGLDNLADFKVSMKNGTIPLLTSKSAIEASTSMAYFKDTNGDVYVKFKAADPSAERVTVFFSWTGNGTYKPSLACTKNDFSPVTNNLGIDDVDGLLTEKIIVYPNPSLDGNFKINNIVLWEVYSIQGSLITKGFSDKVDLSGKSKGIYILKTQNKQFKLIID